MGDTCEIHGRYMEDVCPTALITPPMDSSNWRSVSPGVRVRVTARARVRVGVGVRLGVRLGLGLG